jgi:2,4-dienoyl-CoA reductase (NADPH2)
MDYFTYQDLDQIKKDCSNNNININFLAELEALKQKYILKNHIIKNRLVNQPMEGYDSDNAGGPGELTFRRYKRYAQGGTGIIWFEAVAILPEGRSNPHQLWLNQKTKKGFDELLQIIKKTSIGKYGANHEPFYVLQLTHSGRFSKPEGEKKPAIVVHDAVLDKVVGIDDSYPLLTDDELKIIQEKYVEAAKLAYSVGFEAVDIKSCHKYLISELLGARDREGMFGGSYENRTRFLKETVAMIQNEVPKLMIAVRLNLSDFINSNNSWGLSRENNIRELEDDLMEPLKLINELIKLNVVLLNVSAGTPYYNPHISRPFEQSTLSSYKYEEHPLKGVERLFQLAAEVKEHYPDLPVIGSGYSWLRQFGGNAAAWNIEHNLHTFAGFGRQSFAYPDFAVDLLEKGQMIKNRCCITCSKCSQLMRWGTKTGCVVRDSDIYGPIYKEAREVNKP